MRRRFWKEAHPGDVANGVRTSVATAAPLPAAMRERFPCRRHVPPPLPPKFRRGSRLFFPLKQKHGAVAGLGQRAREHELTALVG